MACRRLFAGTVIDKRTAIPDLHSPSDDMYSSDFNHKRFGRDTRVLTLTGTALILMGHLQGHVTPSTFTAILIPYT